MKKKDPYYEKLDKEFVQKYKSNKWINWGLSLLGLSLAYLVLYFLIEKTSFQWLYIVVGVVLLFVSIALLIKGYRKKEERLIHNL